MKIVTLCLLFILFFFNKSISQTLIKAGTEFIVVSNNEISPSNYKVGDDVYFYLIDSKFLGEKSNLQDKTKFEGIITDAVKPNLFGKGGLIKFRINNLILKNGRKVMVSYESESDQSKFEKDRQFIIKLEKDFNLPYSSKPLSEYALKLLDKYDYKNTYDYFFSKKNNNVIESESYKVNDNIFYVNKLSPKIIGYNRNVKSELLTPIKYHDFINKGGFDSFLDMYASFYGSKINTTLFNSYIDDYRSGNFTYEYIDDLGVFLVIYNTSRDGKTYEGRLNFEIFDPIYGPMIFKKSTYNYGFKFLERQKNFIKLDIVKKYKYLFLKNPDQYNNRYELPNIYHVSPWEGNYPDSSYRLEVSNDDGYVWIDKTGELPIYGMDNIEYNDSLDYYISRKRTLTKSDIEEKYIPTYEEKEAAYAAGAITRAQLVNDNYFYYKSGATKTTFNYGILNKFGYPILNNQFDKIINISNNYFITKLNNKYGLFQLTPKNLKSKTFEIYKNIFEDMLYNGNGVLSVKLNGINYTIDFFGNILSQKN